MGRAGYWQHFTDSRLTRRRALGPGEGMRVLKHPRLQLLSVVLLLTTLALLGPGRMLAQDATVRLVQHAAASAGFNDAPNGQALDAPLEATNQAETDLAASIAWTTSIVFDLLLLMAAVMFSFAAIVLTIWPPTSRGAERLTVSGNVPKPTMLKG